MSLKTMLDFLFGKARKTQHIKDSAEELLYKLRDNGYLSLNHVKELIKNKKTYYKVMRKLKSIGLISIFKDVNGNYNVGLTIDAYKYFVKKNLIEDVEEVLKKK